ncbi:TerD family protein [Akkermansiaceae bacterium]|nr:TerD family protein [Akkermansiaceae bacterium]
MSLPMNKGDKLPLEKGAFTGNKYYVGCGWDQASSGPEIDVDLFVVELDKNGAFTGGIDAIAYYNSQTTLSGSVKLSDDNRDGEGDGDDEFAQIDLDKVPADVSALAVCLNIYQGSTKGQNFGQMSELFARLVRGDNENGEQVAGLTLSPSQISAEATGMEYVRFVRSGAGWDFVARGQILGTPDQGSDINQAAGLLTSI